MTLLRTALYEKHRESSARMVPFAGWEMPVQYSGIVAEHKMVRSGVGLFDISHMGRFSIGGADAEKILDWVFTNSVASMKDGQVRYGLICQEDGGILDDILIYRWPYGFSAVVNASNCEKILAWFQKHAGSANFTLDDRTLATTMIAVQGPGSVGLCAGTFELDPSKLAYYYAMPTRHKLTGLQCVVSRTGYTGEDGFEIMIGNEGGPAIWKEFLDRGALPCGLGARDTLRLEAAMPLYGHELNESIDPIRAKLNWAVKLDKEFIGSAALKAIGAAPGDRPVRVGLEIEGKRAAREGSSLLMDGQTIGTVTSGSFTPWLEKSIAMGYVAPAHSAIGTKLAVDVRGSSLAATIVKMPFYSRKK